MDDEISNTRRMSEEEKNEYRGITLSESGEEETRREEPFREKVRVHVWSTADMPWWKKAITYGVMAAGVVCFFALAWFFLVGGLVLAGAFAAVYFLKKFLAR